MGYASGVDSVGLGAGKRGVGGKREVGGGFPPSLASRESANFWGRWVWEETRLLVKRGVFPARLQEGKCGSNSTRVVNCLAPKGEAEIWRIFVNRRAFWRNVRCRCKWM